MDPYQSFVFESHSYDPSKGKIILRYALEGGPFTCPKIDFEETLTLPMTPQQNNEVTNKRSNESATTIPSFERSLQALHLIGGISYYKTCLPPALEVRTGPLTPEQARFWEMVYEDGLGEFFHKNRLDPTNRIHFPSQATKSTDPSQHSHTNTPIHESTNKRLLVPVGGGKDSVVTIELLRKAGFDITLLRVGKHPVIDRLAKALKLPLLTVNRSLSPALFQLNEEGALNGHVPITAYLSLLGIALTHLEDYDAVIFSNERSASEGNTRHFGKDVNHQWSKGIVFERALQEYASNYIDPSRQFFSLLRPFSELHITKLFSEYPQYLPLTTSCNTNWRILSKSPDKDQLSNLWCGKCPKCAFVFALYSAFLPKETVTKTFGKDLFADASLLPLYRELLGKEGFKPFECVGTPQESAAALLLAHEKNEWVGSPVMEMFVSDVLPTIKDTDALLAEVLTPSPEHEVPEAFFPALDAAR